MQPNQPIPNVPLTPTSSQLFPSSAPKPSPLPEKKKGKRALMVIVSIVLIAIIGAGTVFGLQAFMPAKKTVVAAPAVTAPVANTVASCGTTTVTNTNFSMSPYTGCFDTNFTACTPATITVDNESSFAKGTILKYQIQSKQGASCLVQWQYVALPSNTTWNGKTVTCSYDNTKEFNAAFSAKTDFTGCTGPLVALMSAQNTSQIQGGTTTTESDGSTVTTAPGVTVVKN
jgi:hypothetical protein